MSVSSYSVLHELIHILGLPPLGCKHKAKMTYSIFHKNIIISPKLSIEASKGHSHRGVIKKSTLSLEAIFTICNIYFNGILTSSWWCDPRMTSPNGPAEFQHLTVPSCRSPSCSAPCPRSALSF